jgi:hypothetical protein
MKTILVLVALSTIAAAPALAQRSSTAYHGAHAARQQRLPPAAPHAPDSYYQRFPHIWTG